MGMSIENAILCLKGIKQYGNDTFTKRSQSDWQNSLDIAIDTMRKYQTMQEVLDKVWNVPSCMLDEAECLNKIMETYRTVR